MPGQIGWAAGVELPDAATSCAVGRAVVQLGGTDKAPDPHARLAQALTSRLQRAHPPWPASKPLAAPARARRYRRGSGSRAAPENRRRPVLRPRGDDAQHLVHRSRAGTENAGAPRPRGRCTGPKRPSRSMSDITDASGEARPCSAGEAPKSIARRLDITVWTGDPVAA